MTRLKGPKSIVCALLTIALLGACGAKSSPGDSNSTGQQTAAPTTKPHPNRAPKTLNVPADYKTIQAALDDSAKGDLILVSPGTYHEALDVQTPDLTLRGLERNSVILDGNDELESGIKVAANGVSIENLTIHSYQFNGLLFTLSYLEGQEDPEKRTVLQGYRASHITSYNNGQYGIYAFFASGGVIEDSFTSGHPDSGVYVGQCKPCNTVVNHVAATLNAIGYEGTNASGNLFIINSDFSHNRIGMTPNSQNMERLAPQGDVVLAGNVVSKNDAVLAPPTKGGFGAGIVVAGGNRNLVTHNLVTDNPGTGIMIGDLNGFNPSGNKIVENTITNSGFDLAYWREHRDPTINIDQNCFSKNKFKTENVVGIETAMPCPPKPQSQANVPVSVTQYVQNPQPPDFDYRLTAKPPTQPNMDNPKTAPRTVVDPNAYTKVNVATIKTPVG